MEKDKAIDLPNDLHINPNGTATFTINEEGEISGSYKGIFIFKCYLNPLETLSASRMFRELLGPNGNEASDTDRYTAFTLSQLQKRVISGPPWWQTDSVVPGNIPDNNILSIVLDRAIRAEEAYKGHLKTKKQKSLSKAQSGVDAIKKAQQDAYKEEKEATKPVSQSNAQEASSKDIWE